MVEENKETCKAGEKVKTLFKMLIGAVIVVLGILACVKWWVPLKMLIAGCIGPMLILVGLVVIAVAKE